MISYVNIGHKDAYSHTHVRCYYLKKLYIKKAVATCKIKKSRLIAKKTGKFATKSSEKAMNFVVSKIMANHFSAPLISQFFSTGL